MISSGTERRSGESNPEYENEGENVAEACGWPKHWKKRVKDTKCQACGGKPCCQGFIPT